jgi:hypothetical protein
MTTFQKNKKTYKVKATRLSISNKISILSGMLEGASYFDGIATLNVSVLDLCLDGEEIKTLGDLDDYIEDGILDKVLEYGTLRADYDEIVAEYKRKLSAQPLEAIAVKLIGLADKIEKSFDETNLVEAIKELNDKAKDLDNLKFFVPKDEVKEHKPMPIKTPKDRLPKQK